MEENLSTEVTLSSSSFAEGEDSIAELEFHPDNAMTPPPPPTSPSQPQQGPQEVEEEGLFSLSSPSSLSSEMTVGPDAEEAKASSTRPPLSPSTRPHGAVGEEHHHMLHHEAASSAIPSSLPAKGESPRDTRHVPRGVHPLFYSLHLLRTRQYDRAIDVVAGYRNGGDGGGLPRGTAARHAGAGEQDDEQLWFVQTKAMVLSSWYPDVEVHVEEEKEDLEEMEVRGRRGTTVGEDRVQGPTTSSVAARESGGSGSTGTRRGPHVTTALTHRATAGASRPLSSRFGFASPGTNASAGGPPRPGQLRGSLASRPGEGGRTTRGLSSRVGGPPLPPGSSRRVPGAWMSSAGRGAGGGGSPSPFFASSRSLASRCQRLGTASLQSIPGGPHMVLERLRLEKYARERPLITKVLCDYLLYVEHRPRMALELCRAVMMVDQEEKDHLAGGRAATPNISAMSTHGKMNGVTGGDSTTPPSSFHTGAGGGGTATAGTTPLNARLLLRPPSTAKQIGILASEDWWWKERCGKANYQLGLLREAEKWFKASLFGGTGDAPASSHLWKSETTKATTRSGSSSSSGTTSTAVGGPTAAPPGLKFRDYHSLVVMELAKVYRRLDQPLAALELYRKALAYSPRDASISLCLARLLEELHDSDAAFEAFSSVLAYDNRNVEAIACVAAYYFYEKNQPELSLRFYRRLLQMGIQQPEVWNNIGLAAYLSVQLEVALSCFEKALFACEEDSMRADVWYNMSHVGIALGDLTFAERALRIAVQLDETHGEAWNNLAVLAIEKGILERSKKKKNSKKKGKHKKKTSKKGVETKEGVPELQEGSVEGKKTLEEEPEEEEEEEDGDGRQAWEGASSHTSTGMPGKRELEEAKQLIAVSLSVAPLLEEALFNSAWMWYEDGEIDEAHKEVLQLIEVHPEHPEGLALLGELRKKLNV